jgi:serine/threonine-protein kinase
VSETTSDQGSAQPASFGRYQVVAPIPGGNMGRLYLAQDREIDRQVVIKTLDRDCSADQKQRFLREARAAGRLNHRNVVSIFDVGEQDRTPFIVMEHIAGDTLAAVIRNREPLLFSRRLDLIDQLCAGLAYAHDLGVVHRDIKPSNIMLDRSGTLRILDFGIARLDTGEQTQVGTSVVGTLNYMSPEQWEGGTVDGRTDMFAVGAVMYELFSFTKAFPGNAPPEVLRVIFGEGPKPLQDVCPLAPAALVKIVNRMLARSPADRYDTLHEVREAFAGVRALVEDAQGGAGIELADKTMVSGAAPVKQYGSAIVPSPTRKMPVQDAERAEPVEVRVRKIPLGLIAAGAILMFGIGGWLMFGGGSRNEGSTPPSAGTNPPAASPPTAPAASTPITSPGTSPNPSPAAIPTPPPTPPPAPPKPVDITVTWAEAFEIRHGDKVISVAATRHVLVQIPAGQELYAHSDRHWLHSRIPTDKSGSVSVPPLGRLAVTLVPRFMTCMVVVDRKDLRRGLISPDRPEKMAAGRHEVSLRCEDNKLQGTQIIEIKSGLDPTIVNFTGSGGG